LEEVAHPLVAAIEGPGVPAEEGPHRPGEGAGPCPHQEVGVIGEQGPGEHGDGPSLGQALEPAEEFRAVRVVAEDHLPVEASHHHMVEGPRSIEARLAGHGKVENITK
jgi:hypothetical protein